MNLPFDKEAAIEKLKEKISEDWLIKHSLASGAVMRACAEKLGEDADAWEILGLIHDIDFQETAETPDRHTVLAGEWLMEWGFPDEAIVAIQAHNEMADHGKTRDTLVAKSLSCCEAITGLVATTALVQPDKKLASVKAKSVKKRMKDKAFARKVSREDIMFCEEIGIPLAEFCEMAVAAMQEISDDLGM